jgi:hypothetical protein
VFENQRKVGSCLWGPFSFDDNHQILVQLIQAWRISVLNEERSGSSIEVTTDEMIHKIHDIVVADRRMNIREIVEIVDISSEPVQNIVHEYLGMTKL